jgi:D-3-phosphoglycerate dehydrogenase
MKVLVTSKSFGKADPEVIRYLGSQGIELVWSDVPNPSAEDISRQIPGCSGLIVGNDTVDRRVLDAGDSLKIIHMNGTGLDAIDVDAARERGILVMNAPGANRNAVAEMTLSMMLALGRRLDTHIRILREKRWERKPGHEISGSTVGIIGLGNIGRRLVELLGGFDVTRIAFDPHADAAWAASHGVRITSEADDVFREADWVILLAALTESTGGMVNRRTLGLMKPSAYLINTSRGGIIDEDALCEAIRENRIAGAALDAFADEPLPPDSPLRELDILLTPHVAASSVESAAKVSWIVARNLTAVLVNNHRGCYAQEPS